MRFLILILLGAVLFLLNLFTGSVSIPAGDVIDILFHGDINNGPMDFIILGSRLPQALTALLAGSALTVAGLLLQTAFRNPLAGPSILGITSGAGLGVALVMLLLGGTISFAGFSAGGYVAVLIGALAGSLAVMALLLLFSVWLKSDLMLLIAGIMTGYLTSSVVTLLNYLSSAEGIQSFTMWGMGSFGSVSRDQLPVFSIAIGIGLLLSILLVKPLNIILLGENYARNLGISMQWVRNMLLVATGVLTSVVTAFCGPIGFIGLAVPHISRMIFRTSDHRIMIPGCILAGAVTGLLCNLLCILPRDMILPLNGVTPLIGVPVILYVIFKKR
ncbi:MAG: iron ABC transporter permease [Bacteroides sp.]|nr:iron ABC transporter permease [Bacteroides sp.]MDE6258497.1 iron ABC transporter permease [Muribaculaceae bacterium]